MDSLVVSFFFENLATHIFTIYHPPPKDENIGNHGYIGTLIFLIYQIYIGGYFDKKYR